MAAPEAPPATGGIVTPEAVRLDFAEAGLGSRALGFLVDLGVRVGLLWAFLTVVGVAGAAVSETFAIVVVVASVFAALLVYPVVCETIWNGKTVGKMLVGLRVVTVEGAPVRFRHAAIRSALGIVDFLIGAGSVAIVTALATRQSQRLGDLAAGTIVIRERQAGAYAQPILFEPPVGWGPYVAGLDISGLDDDAYVLLRSFLLRVHELRADARVARSDELAAWVTARTGQPVPPGQPAELFLVAVAAAYQQRHGGPRSVASTGPASFGPAAPGTIPPPVWTEPLPPATWGSP